MLILMKKSICQISKVAKYYFVFQPKLYSAYASFLFDYPEDALKDLETQRELYLATFSSLLKEKDLEKKTSKFEDLNLAYED